MNLDRAVMAFAGVMILISVLLVYFVSPWWLLFTAFIGLNMLQASFTGFCPAAMLRTMVVTIDSIMKPVLGAPVGMGVASTGGIATQTPAAKIFG